MIISDTGIIKVSNCYLKQYKELGFSNIKQGDIINLPIEYCSKIGTSLIVVKCHYCNNEKQTRYCDYTNSINKFPYKYCCSYRCNGLKHKEVMLNKYGVDNYTKHSDFDKKQKETNIRKFGVNSYTKTRKFKEDYIKTTQERYGLIAILKLKNSKKNFKELVWKDMGLETPLKIEIYLIKHN